MFLMLSFKTEFLRCADSSVHWTLCKDWGDTGWRQHFKISPSRCICTRIVCSTLHGDLRDFVTLYAFWFVEGQQLWLCALHLIKLLLLFLIAWIPRLLSSHFFKNSFLQTYFLQPVRHFFLRQSLLFFRDILEFQFVLTWGVTEKLNFTCKIMS